VSIYITNPGFLTTVQDQGRFGYAALGVPRAGAMDPNAADLANRLVGNDHTMAVLECTMSGITLTAERALTMAVTGAPCAIWVGNRPRAFAEAFTVSAGSEVIVSPAREGVRTYLAFSGGVDVPPVLGSRSTDTLAYVGPDVVRARSRLPIGQGRSSLPENPPIAVASGQWSSDVALRLHPGPRLDWVEESALEALEKAPYLVSELSNRVGLRLRGQRIGWRVADRELPSEGLVLGAVQVPPDGQPLVFLNDHPVTGGYPVVAVVDLADLGQCAQLRPGDRVHFTQFRRPVAPNPGPR
jgi:biotin-dependent carboxylase-like uncharacterized protein